MGANDERPPIWTGHVVAYAPDPRQAAEFYEAIGMRPIASMDDFAVLELRGGTHLVVQRDVDHAGVAVDFDLMVEDLAATHAAWSSAGFDVGPIEHDGIHDTFTVRDPAGNVITVFSSHVAGPV